MITDKFFKILFEIISSLRSAVLKHTQELFAAVIACKAIALSCAFQNLSERLQKRVAGFTSAFLVYVFEVIELYQTEHEIILKLFSGVFFNFKVAHGTVRKTCLSVRVHNIIEKFLASSENDSADTSYQEEYNRGKEDIHFDIYLLVRAYTCKG